MTETEDETATTDDHRPRALRPERRPVLPAKLWRLLAERARRNADGQLASRHG